MHPIFNKDIDAYVRALMIFAPNLYKLCVEAVGDELENFHRHMANAQRDKKIACTASERANLVHFTGSWRDTSNIMADRLNSALNYRRVLARINDEHQVYLAFGADVTIGDLADAADAIANKYLSYVETPA